MIDKRVDTMDAALDGIKDGSVVMVGGFGDVGVPMELTDALAERGVTDLTVIANNAGAGERGIAALLRGNQVRKVVCSYPRGAASVWFERRYAAGQVELELVPQGTLSERIRAAGAGIGAFFTPTGAGTDLCTGKETREINGRTEVLEYALHADVALIKAARGDRWGNLVYHAAARNYAPTMAAAADLTIAQVSDVVDLGELDPEEIVTPGVFVDRLIRIAP
jgi:3-oxoadipate CoA-transferase, alpha subunit